MGRNIEISIKTDDCHFKYIVDKQGYDKIKLNLPNYYLNEDNLEQARKIFKLLKETFDKNRTNN